jgi:dihydroflavonol-4-reductase
MEDPQDLAHDGVTMTTLVTGATGFIGGNLARTLSARGGEVRALVRPGANNLAIRDTTVKQVPGDLLDSNSLRRAADGCESIYHCAATYSFWAKRPEDIYRTNVAGTRNLLDAAHQAGVRRVVFTSSVSTIGLPDLDSSHRGQLGSEELPPDPSHLIGHYKQSKYTAEQLALAANDEDFEVVVVNPCAPVGKWDVKPTPTGRIPLDFAKGRIPGYLSTGMNLVDVEDVAAGHLLAMEKGEPGQRYLLGNRNVSLKEVFAMLEEATGLAGPKWRAPYWLVKSAGYLDQWVEGGLLHREPKIPLEGVRVSQTPMYVSCRKAVTELGQPQSPVEDALAKSIKWFEEYGYVKSRGRGMALAGR